ncbi:hypothetical protein DERP_003538 [Dermatophagoides pteronyssinus]|uniref:Uncharacterized protein n=1 Tax=Dermatophagoides pteronyssinus TaxID=6956 RepID=A0ABQ8JKX3_DERPT|nr:hypothetical protein DERP_003538 [Dermatophagoides pteronyssinus]
MIGVVITDKLDTTVSSTVLLSNDFESILFIFLIVCVVCNDCGVVTTVDGDEHDPVSILGVVESGDGCDDPRPLESFTTTELSVVGGVVGLMKNSDDDVLKAAAVDYVFDFNIGPFGVCICINCGVELLFTVVVDDDNDVGGCCPIICGLIIRLPVVNAFGLTRNVCPANEPVPDGLIANNC